MPRHVQMLHESGAFPLRYLKENPIFAPQTASNSCAEACQGRAGSTETHNKGVYL